MRRLRVAGALTAALLATPCLAGTTPQELENIRVATAYFDYRYHDHDADKALSYVADNLIDHERGLGSDKAALREDIENLSRLAPHYSVEILRTFADGDYVIFHTIGHGMATDRAVAIEIYRLQNGKISEIWEVAQFIPDKSSNKFPIY